MYNLAEQTAQCPSDFLTEDLIGKRRFAYWTYSIDRYRVSFDNPRLFALIMMHDNDDEALLEFLNENHRKVYLAIKNCEY